MRTKIILFTIATALAGTSAAARDETSPVSRVKSKEQIRCELIGDCQPLPATRAWITRTGEVETDRTKIFRAQQQRLVPVRPQAQPGRSRDAQAQLAIKPVKSSNLFINFGLASWEIDDTAFAQATEVYAALRPDEWRAYRFEIAGHTDALGSAAENEGLSKKRAQAVVDLLVARGVARSQLVVKGYGFRRPIEGLERLDGRNRRVEITRLD